MQTDFSSAFSTLADGFDAGIQAAAAPIEELAGSRVDFCQVFCADAYEYEALLRGIRDVLYEFGINQGQQYKMRWPSAVEGARYTWRWKSRREPCSGSCTALVESRFRRPARPRVKRSTSPATSPPP